MVKYNGLSTLEVLEWAHNYNRWIAECFLPYIESPAIEIGAGIGNITSYFLSKRPLFITDRDFALVGHLGEKFSGKKEIKTIRFDIEKNPPRKFLSYFSSVIGINVLEHIEDDIKALENSRTILKKDGRLMLFVPAKKFAYTRLDKELGHFRRYEKAEIIDKLSKSGYGIEKIYYFNIVGLLSWFVRDKISKSYHLKPYQISIFNSIVPILKRLENIYNPPIGISLVVHARKI